MKIILILILSLTLTGCLKDDVQNVEEIARIQQLEIYKTYYSMGVYNGMVSVGVSEDDAAYYAGLMTEEMFLYE